MQTAHSGSPNSAVMLSNIQCCVHKHICHAYSTANLWPCLACNSCVEVKATPSLHKPTCCSASTYLPELSKTCTGCYGCVVLSGMLYCSIQCDCSVDLCRQHTLLATCHAMQRLCWVLGIATPSQDHQSLSQWLPYFHYMARIGRPMQHTLLP